MAARNGRLGDVFDPNPACVQRQHGSGRARAIGGPGGLAWAIAAGRGQGELLERAGAGPPRAAAAKPAKLPTKRQIARVFSRLAQTFQHCPSNMPDQAEQERQFSAIHRIRAAHQAEQLRELGLVDLAGGRRAAQARDRAPKLLPRTRTRTLQIAISGPYFIRFGRKAVRSRSRGARLFPRSHARGGWKRARKRLNPLHYIGIYLSFPCYQEKREDCTSARA